MGNGKQMKQIQAGCQQRTACINNMRQNFWQENGKIGMIKDPVRHQCKIFSDMGAYARDVHSVCHTCCFEDSCTFGWKPTQLGEWIKVPGLSSNAQTMLFDQMGGRPPVAFNIRDPNKVAPLAAKKEPQKLQVRGRTLPSKGNNPRNQAMRFSLNVDKNG